MNDFTKEELEYLISCPSVNCRVDIVNKIKSMIDNYDKQKPAIVFVRGESRDISEFYDE